MLAPSRNTTEQRSRMDAVELGNDSGSLPAAGGNGFTPTGGGILRQQVRTAARLRSTLLSHGGMGDTGEHLSPSLEAPLC